MNRHLILALALLSFTTPPAQAAEEGPVRLLHGLGTLSMPVTATPEAQAYFDQGLRLFYAFNFDESVRAFREGSRLDSGCAMCEWGVAIALGPNINAPMDPRRGQTAYRAIEEARARAAGATPRERDYIDALATRYAADPFADRGPQDAAFAQAMGVLAQRYPDDADAAVIHAAAVMQLSPWDYWTAEGVARPGLSPVVARLARVTEVVPDHPGACHFYIHLVESAWPARAVPCADRLPSLMPAAGHIVHMPAHVYIRVGRYEDAVERNRHAVHADETYIADRRPTGEYPLAYYPHNYHFLAFAAGMAGQETTAVDAARQVASRADASLLTDPDLGGTLQHFITTPVSMLVRFERWDEVLDEPAFDAHLTYPRGHWHFARGMAHVAQGRLDDAEVELTRLREMTVAPATAAVSIFGLNTGPSVLAIAEAVLAGRIHAARGEVDQAVEALRDGIAAEDAMTYNEPPDWHLSVRWMLGQVYVEAGRWDDAETAFQEDLATYPGNHWSEVGLETVRRRR